MHLFIFFMILGLGLAEKTRYDGYQMWEVIVITAEDAQFLAELQESESVVDITGSLRPSGSATITLAPESVASVSSQLQNRNIVWSVSVENIQDLMDSETMRIQKRKGSTMAYDPSDYNTGSDISSRLSSQTLTCPSKGLTCSYSGVAYTYGALRTYYYKIGTGGDKPIIWINGAMHGRDWLTASTTVRLYDHLLERYGIDEDVTTLLDNYEFWFFAIANLDGYYYSWDYDRMYKKNRQPVAQDCIGVDLDKNFDFRWRQQGVSTSPCSDNYCGPSAASERDTDGFQAVLRNNGERFAAFITLNTQGQMWTFPWSNTEDYSLSSPCERTDDYDDLSAVAKAATDAIYLSSFRSWRYGTTCELLDASTGSAADYAKGAAGIKYSFTVNVRGNFLAPASEIDVAFSDVWNGIVGMVNKIEEIEGQGFPLNG